MPTRVKKRLKKQVIAAAHRLNATVASIAKARGVRFLPKVRFKWYPRMARTQAEVTERFYEGILCPGSQRWILAVYLYRGQQKASRPFGKTKEEVMREMLDRLNEERVAIESGEPCEWRDSGDRLEYLESGWWRP